MDSFERIYARAARRKGGDAALEGLLPTPKSEASLAATGDDRFLSQFAKSIFQAGFVWRVVENKWPGFEEAFEGFEPGRIANLPDESVEALAQDTRIIRNGAKIKAVRDNAVFLCDLAREHGSAARFFAAWPTTDLIGLLEVMKRRGRRLGGMTGQYSLRFIGKDCYILSRDVTAALIGQGVVDKPPTSKRDLAAAQAAFNRWHEQGQVREVLDKSAGSASAEGFAFRSFRSSYSRSSSCLRASI